MRWMFQSWGWQSWTKEKLRPTTRVLQLLRTKVWRVFGIPEYLGLWLSPIETISWSMKHCMAVIIRPKVAVVVKYRVGSTCVVWCDHSSPSETWTQGQDSDDVFIPILQQQMSWVSTELSPWCLDCTNIYHDMLAFQGYVYLLWPIS